jgi:hypothetical protein
MVAKLNKWEKEKMEGGGKPVGVLDGILMIKIAAIVGKPTSLVGFRLSIKTLV